MRNSKPCELRCCRCFLSVSLALPYPRQEKRFCRCFPTNTFRAAPRHSGGSRPRSSISRRRAWFDGRRRGRFACTGRDVWYACHAKRKADHCSPSSFARRCSLRSSHRSSSGRPSRTTKVNASFPIIRTCPVSTASLRPARRAASMVVSDRPLLTESTMPVSLPQVALGAAGAV